MRIRLTAGPALALLCALAAAIGPVRAGDPAPQEGRAAVEKGLAFLEADAAKWRKERQCASCHQGTMSVWALAEAKRLGYPVSADTLADNVKWTQERLANLDAPRDPRPGWNMVNTPAVYLALLARAAPGQEAVTANEVRRIAGHLARHQEADGSWAWSLAPAQNRPPPVFESDEVVTRMAYLALGPVAAADAKEKAAARETRERAAAWLAKAAPEDTTQAAALRLLAHAWEAAPAKDLKTEVDQFLARQQKDGGWGQVPGAPSDAYATGQALYFLALAGVKERQAAVQRGVAFLAATQRADGSWPMTSRAHPGAKPMTNPVPITYFGSAWATLGLLRTVAR